MGLFRDVYGMVSQAQQADLAEKRMNQDMELKQRYYEKQMRDYNDANRRRDDVYSGIKELGELDRTIGETSFEKTMMEQRFQQSALKDPDEAKQFLIQTRVLSERLRDLGNVRKVKGAELTYRSIDGGFAKAKALDLADFLNGKEPSESGMATVTKKRKILDENGMDTGETETVTMKVPQSESGYGGYVGGESQAQAQASAPQQSGYNPYSMAGAMVESSAPLGDATPEYARPYAPEQSQGMLMRDIANVPVQSPAQNQSQVMQAQPQADVEAVRQDALSAISRARTPEERQRVKDRAAKLGVQLP
jgi:hypothetical protein